MRRFFALVLLAVGFALVGAPAASAHDVLKSTTPSDGTTVEQLPQAITLTFSEKPLALGLQVLVKGPGGDVAQGVPTIDGPVVTQPLSPQAPAGSYVVTYRVTSSDGHPISGTFSFHANAGLDGSTATQAAQAAQAANQGDPPQQSTGNNSSTTPILLIIGAVVIVLIFGAAAWSASRRSRDTADRP